MNALVLTTDAFGGHGGIAKYNRDLLAALCASPRTHHVYALARHAMVPLEAVPSKLTFSLDGLGGKARYAAALAAMLGRVSSVGLVICAHVNLMPLAYLAAVRYGAPLVLSMHGIEVWTRSESRLQRALLARLDAVLSVSETTAQRFCGWAPVEASKVSIIPNSVELGAFGVGRKPAALIERYALVGRTVLASFGRLAASERLKGFDEVIEVLPRLLVRRPDLVYLVLGDGGDRRRLELKARALGVGDSVVFAGHVEEREKADHYRLADVFVMPSRGEGFGIVFLEAMACGIPVVASRLDGGREALRDGALGSLVDPRDLDELERAIFAALERPRVVPPGLEYFSVERFNERVHDWLGRVIG